MLRYSGSVVPVEEAPNPTRVNVSLGKEKREGQKMPAKKRQSKPATFKAVLESKKGTEVTVYTVNGNRIGKIESVQSDAFCLDWKDQKYVVPFSGVCYVRFSITKASAR